MPTKTRRPVRRDAKGRPVTLERRRIRLQPSDFRAVNKNGDGLATTFTAIVLRYSVIDDYGTRFVPGVFDESMLERMPRICWAHDWTDPLGRWTDIVRNDQEVLELRAEFDDFVHVPSAARASAQLGSGTIDQFSVGFYREDDRPADDPKLPGIYDIVRGELVEASPVLVGAVPNTALTGMRSTPSGLLVPVEEVERIIVSLAGGSMDIVDALNQARELAAPDEGDGGQPAEGSEVPGGASDGAAGSDVADPPPPASDPAPAADVTEPPPAAAETDTADDQEDETGATAEEDASLLAELDDVVAAFNL